MSEDIAKYDKGHSRLSIVVADTDIAAVRLMDQQKEDVVRHLEELLALTKKYRCAQLLVAMAFSDDPNTFLPKREGPGVRLVSGSCTMNGWDVILLAKLLADQEQMSRKGDGR